jgi:hypothetical protein
MFTVMVIAIMISCAGPLSPAPTRLCDKGQVLQTHAEQACLPSSPPETGSSQCPRIQEYWLRAEQENVSLSSLYSKHDSATHWAQGKLVPLASAFTYKIRVVESVVIK